MGREGGESMVFSSLFSSSPSSPGKWLVVQDLGCSFGISTALFRGCLDLYVVRHLGLSVRSEKTTALFHSNSGTTLDSASTMNQKPELRDPFLIARSQGQRHLGQHKVLIASQGNLPSLYRRTSVDISANTMALGRWFWKIFLAYTS